MIESNSLGVVWGIGYDHTAWVHTGGYGGGFFQGKCITSLSKQICVFFMYFINIVFILHIQVWQAAQITSTHRLM